MPLHESIVEDLVINNDEDSLRLRESLPELAKTAYVVIDEVSSPRPKA